MATYVRVQTVEHAIGARGALTLRVTAADVRIRAVEGDTATVRATFELSAGSDADADAVFERVRFRTDATDGRLEVEEPDRDRSLAGAIGRLLSGRDGVSLAVEATLPVGADLRLETVSGDVWSEGLAGAQRYNSVSGDLFLADAGGDLRVETVSGDVTVRASRPVAMRVDAVSGDLSLAAPRIDALRVHGVSGDVEVEGPLAPDGEFRVETVSGDVGVGLAGGATFEVRGLASDISADLDHRVEGREDRRRVIVGDGRPHFAFHSMSGDLSIRRARSVGSAPPVAAGPAAPAAPAVPAAAASDRPTPGEELAILQALERGEIDVDEAARRLAGSRRDA